MILQIRAFDPCFIWAHIEVKDERRACLRDSSILVAARDVSFLLLTINNEDTLHLYSLTDALDVLYQLARSRKLFITVRKMYVIRARLLRTGVLQCEDSGETRALSGLYAQSREQSTNFVAETTWLQPLCLVPFLLFFRYFPSRLVLLHFTVPPGPVSFRRVASRCGKNYRIFSDASTRLWRGGYERRMTAMVLVAW